MKCRYCNIALAPLRSLTDGEFCSDEHRVAFSESGGAELGFSPPLEGGLVAQTAHLEPASGEAAAVHLKTPAPMEFRPKTMAAPAFSSTADGRATKGWGRIAEGLLALKFGTQLFNTPEKTIPQPTADPNFPAHPVLPGAQVVAAQVDAAPPKPAFTPAMAAALYRNRERAAADLEADEIYEPGQTRFQQLASEAGQSLRWMVDVWRKAPSELKIMTVLLPILLAVAVSPSTPSVKIPGGAADNVQKMMSERWVTLNKNIVSRAAVAYTDDFRSGLDGWESRSNLTTRWSYDATGFVQPGPLAVFRPTVDLTDYRLEFLGEIDKKGMGCAFRATNLDNYYAVKFIVVRPGPLPEVHVVRYAVIGGKEGPHVEKPLPFVTRADMLYRIRVDVQGSDFAIRAQDQIVDFWSDDRIPRGGVGLFCAHGEKARVRWLEVSHQYDTLGRLCAYLAPYGTEGRNGNLN
jgi:hypothetical protein